MSFFNDWATGRAIRDATRQIVRYLLPIIGALYLVTDLVHLFGGPCIIPNSIACTFSQQR